MRKFFIIIATSFFLLVGFDHQKDLELVEVNTTINEAQKTITYDFKIKNIGKSIIGDGFDYPWYNYGGMEVVVVPNKSLEVLMKMMENTRYKKIELAGIDSQGIIHPNEIADFHST